MSETSSARSSSRSAGAPSRSGKAGDDSPKEIWSHSSSWSQPSPLVLRRPLLHVETGLLQVETAVDEERAAASSAISQRQLDCLRTIFSIYAEKHLDLQSRPSRPALSISSDAWRRLCRDLFRGGRRGTPLLPLASLAELFASVAAPRVVEPYTFLQAGLPPRLQELHIGFPAFLDLFAEVAARWWPRAKLSDLASDVVRAKTKREVQASPLAIMLDEIACCALNYPENERILAARQYKKDGGMVRLSLWDLQMPRQRPGANACAVPATPDTVGARRGGVTPRSVTLGSCSVSTPVASAC